MESKKGLRSLSTVDMARFNEKQIVGSHELSGKFLSLPLCSEKEREGVKVSLFATTGSNAKLSCI